MTCRGIGSSLEAQCVGCRHCIPEWFDLSDVYGTKYAGAIWLDQWRVKVASWGAELISVGPHHLSDHNEA